MKRLFLDANVLFSAAHNPNGKAALLIELGKAGVWRPLDSEWPSIEPWIPACAGMTAWLNRPPETRRIVIDVTAWYWHFRGILWIYVFGLLYLAR